MRHPVDPTRRQWLRTALGAGAAAGALGPLATLSLAATAPTAGAAGSRRFVMVILRGGLDGLYAVPAVGDPDFAAARGALAQYASTPLPLSGPFALHPNLTQLHAMYTAGEASVVHATGLAYNERSHFDAQNVLESGGARPFPDHHRLARPHAGAGGQQGHGAVDHGAAGAARQWQRRHLGAGHAARPQRRPGHAARAPLCRRCRARRRTRARQSTALRYLDDGRDERFDR